MNKKIFVAVVIVYLGYKIFNKRSKMIFDKILAKYGTQKSKKFKEVFDALNTLPLSKTTMDLLLAQVLNETGMFSSLSNVYDLNKNASGILYTGSKGQKANGATKGSKRMSIEGGYYARFDTLNNWAKEYYRVLNRGALPLKAIDAKDFAVRLKQNGYFTAPLAEYQKNLIFFHDFLIKNGI